MSKIFKIHFILFLIIIFTAANAAKFIDLTHTLTNHIPIMPFSQKFELKRIYAGRTPDGFYYAENMISTPEHIGTHIDAPKHFVANGNGIAALPLQDFIGKAIKIDLTTAIQDHCNFNVTRNDLLEWEKQHGKIPTHSIVLLQTGFGRYWNNPKKYLGTAARGRAGAQALCFPGVSADAAEFLVTQRHVKAVGIDTESIDAGNTKTYPAHQIFTKNNVIIIENVANLSALPSRGFIVYALPIKIKDGTGAPARVIAVMP